MPRLSQRDRLNAALSDFRMAHAQANTSPLDAAKRAEFAKGLLSQAWTRKHFSQQRFGWRPSWRGDKLTVLHEMSYYLLPRETWATPRDGRESWVRRETVWTLVLLVQHTLGREAASKLRKALTANGVKYRPRRVMTAAQKAALRERSPFKTKKIEAKIAVLDRALVNLGKQITTTRAAIKEQQHAVTKGKRRITFED